MKSADRKMTARLSGLMNLEDNAEREEVVAGVGFEPTTCGL